MCVNVDKLSNDPEDLGGITMADSSYLPDDDDGLCDEDEDYLSESEEREQVLPCPECGGKGTVGGGDQCPSCAGFGFAADG